MKITKIHNLLFAVTALIIVGHATGSYFRLYETVQHYDSGMHFLGGIWVGCIFLFLIHTRGLTGFLPASYPLALFSIAGFVLTVGFFWELFELSLDIINMRFYHLPPLIQTNALDPLKDLFLDWLGGITAFLLGVSRAALEQSEH